MRLGGLATYLAEATSESDIKKLADWANSKKLPIITVGEGSNIVWRDEGFTGLIIVNRIRGIKIIDEDEDSCVIEFHAGEKWDEAVAYSVKKNLSGIEFLSLIPGYVGAAPVQNIGAYGGELSNTLFSLRAYDTRQKDFVEIKNDSCTFSYRSSKFKTVDKHRYIIISIKLRLSKASAQPPFYEALQKYFDENGINEFSPAKIREAVIAIRRAKLPDPSKVANNGSFFTNPIIEKPKMEELSQKYPEIKGWPYGNKFKISAAWLVDEAGFKDFKDKETGMATWHAQALVLVNERAKTTGDLLIFRNKIIAKVHALFGITLEQEPELLP